MASDADGRKVIENKVVILGHTGVGKTSLVNHYVRGRFTNSTTTIGAAYIPRTIDIDKSTRVSLQIWDTAGQERFRSMLPMYYRNAQAAILVYDVTDPSTMDKLPEWVTELHQRGSPDIILYIAANKADLRDADPSIACVPHDEAVKFAKSINASLFETSAKTGHGIHALFNDLAQSLYRAHLAAAAKVTDGDKGKGGVDVEGKDGKDGKSGSICC